MRGKVRPSVPYTQPASALMAMNSPMVTITMASGFSLPTGRMMVTSMIAPPTTETAMAPRMASTIGRPASCSCQATKVENMAISPWAKLRMEVDRKMRTMARASAA